MVCFDTAASAAIWSMFVPAYPWRRNTVRAASRIARRFRADRPSSAPCSTTASPPSPLLQYCTVQYSNGRRTPMASFVTSADGTRIAYDRLGAGPAVVVVSGMFCDRGTTQELAERLAA